MKRIKKIFKFFAERPLLMVILGFFIFFLILFLYAMMDTTTEDTALANAEFKVIENSKFPVMDYFIDRQEYLAMEEPKENEEGDKYKELMKKPKEMEDKHQDLYDRNLRNLYVEQFNQNDGGMITDHKSIEDLGKEVTRVQDRILAKNENTRLNEYGDIVYSMEQIEKLVDLGAKLRNGMLYDRDGNLINKDGIIITPARKEIKKPQQKEAYIYPKAPSKEKISKRRRHKIAPKQIRALREMGESRVVVGVQVAKNVEIGVYDFGVGGFSNYNEKDITSNEHRLYRTITANKNIPAVLNNPISSQISGKVTAMVTEDIYANMGRAVLIPKGSYVVGYYRNNNKIGEYRLDLVWTRIITPQGVNLVLTKEARGSDVKGYSGLVGEIIEKNWEKYGMPILLSTISNIGIMGETGTLSNLGTSNNNPSIIIKEGTRVLISPNVDIFIPYPRKKK